MAKESWGLFFLGLFVGVLIVLAFKSQTPKGEAKPTIAENVEEWSTVRDEKGRLVKIVVHRRATEVE